MKKMHPEFPQQFESERLILRCYRPRDGKWYYAMSLRLNNGVYKNNIRPSEIFI